MGGTIPLPSPNYVDVRYPDNKLAFRYDPKRGIIEVQRNSVRYYFDLTLLPLELESDEVFCYNKDN
jgi:hypothetical protein